MKEIKKLTHADLIEAAKKYLQKKHSLVITEMHSATRETPDVIGWTPYCSTLIECKTSLVDFKNDKKKIHNRFPEKAMGNYRYYFTQRGLAPLELLPEKWGLIERWEKTSQVIKKAEFRACNQGNEMVLLLSSIRRIGQNAPPGISVKCYTHINERMATLSIALPGDDLVEKISSLVESRINIDWDWDEFKFDHNEFKVELRKLLLEFKG